MASESRQTEEFRELAGFRRDAYGMLSALYLEIPDVEFVKRIRNDGFSSRLNAISSAKKLPGEIRDGARLMETFLAATRSLSEEDLRSKIGVDWTMLLKGVSKGDGPPPPFEQLYNNKPVDFVTQLLPGLVDEYTRAGVQVGSPPKARYDYIGMELDFMRFLVEREAEGWQGNRPDDALSQLQLEEGFLTDHAGPWIPRFCETALALARTDFYRGVLQFTKGFLAMEVENIPAYIQVAEASR